MKNDVQFDVLIKKMYGNLSLGNYNVTKFFDTSFTDPMAFFNGVNWYNIGIHICSKYGIGDRDSLEFIKQKLISIFRGYEQREVLQ
jgi:hypothetical protein